MSESNLVSYRNLTKNYSRRTAQISKITIHHAAGVGTAQSIVDGFMPMARKASANYCIGNDGMIGQSVLECHRAWTSSNAWNDNQAITIEVSNSQRGGDWPISDAAYKSLIDLCVDICQRNGIKTVNYNGTKNGVLTEHRMFAATQCVPIESEVLTRDGWKTIEEVEIGEEIACPDLDLNITFEEVYAKVPPKRQDTYTNNDFTATKDHRMVYHTQYNKENRIDYYNNLLKKETGVYIPLAGHSNFDGLEMSEDMERFLIAVQADGHYMYEINGSGDRSYYGVEFHLTKPRKIERIKEILCNLGLEYTETLQSNGTVKIRIYNKDGVNIVNDICEKFLQDKHFTWEWINLSNEQADLFFDEIMLWDGCVSAKRYDSKIRINLDIVNALAALHNIGSRVLGDSVQFRDTPYITLGEQTKRHTASKGDNKTIVSCVSVKTGIFLCRQYGKTFIIGNCPGPYIHNLLVNGSIASQINARLRPQTISDRIYEGIDLSPVFNATYYGGRYPDLLAAGLKSPDQLWMHFTTFGMLEARQASAEFSPVTYRNTNPDLNAAFGDDWEAYYKHYCMVGKAEIESGQRKRMI